MKKIIFISLFTVSLACNGFALFKYMKIYDAIESGVEHEAVLEMGLADLVYYLKNSDLPPSKILELAKKQPLKKSDERMKPEFSGSRFYQFPIEIIFSHKGNILSVKVAEESF